MPTHLAIVMEYAAGGELFDRIYSAGRFSEDEIAMWLILWWKYIPVLVILSKMFFAGLSLFAALGFLLYGGRNLVWNNLILASKEWKPPLRVCLQKRKNWQWFQLREGFN
ncbi:uncharacterized protein LOC105776136 isoform X3 [Gossypium raimondii]|uniref:THH1/TOM1/TOM3 domain-containing protein n=2 Tax=Gossypium raimondii TaxID=29730 RepID=A0A0D2QX96_GOSRA|nr:uncharacterized protein LOC105776136 isoform X3 [Gossypium raimondii]XP_052485748.1 uncharacterized protein LOC105776136 isoform X3 [Gossypium raimondii]KJB11900.1 hypothetical protein B456_002G040200 [Gossypium raimondii]